MNRFPVTIYHNPKCGTSRNTLAMIRAAGYEPSIIEYLQTGWKRPQLTALLTALDMSAHEIMRTKGTPAEELGLTNPDIAEEAIIAAMIEHPVLVNRPIVVTPRGAKLCRPSEVVLDLLETISASFVKEDGEIVHTKQRT
jgi:arsenate reductase